MAENIYNWQFNCIPGNANQGAILMTRDDIQRPPFAQDDFIWKAMEDIIGVANCKLEYDEEHNLYKIYKAKGHQDNEGNWSYEWEQFGEWEALTEEVAQALKDLIYVSYDFVQTTVDGITTLKMYGIRKNGNRDLLTTITFVSKQYVDDVIANIKEVLAGTALQAVDSGNNQRTLNVKYKNDELQVDASNQLGIVDLYKLQFKYKGEVDTYSDLPSNAKKGDVYCVIKEADMYVNISNTSTPSWKSFTEINEAFNSYAIELHKDENGLYAQLRYDNVDFMIDQFYNLKSQLIDDTLDASSPLANRKTYSIDKILQLLSSMFVYKGQVDYYDQLPTTGNKVGDTWNVKYVGTSTQGSTELDGDNYAWNGTGWDDLSGEYRAGAGIVINGKTISATGISFIVGDGLQATGAGTTQTLSTRITDGLQRVNVGTTANPVYADGVKAGSAIEVNSNGVNVKTGDTTKTDRNTGNLEVDYANGLTQDANNKLITNNGKGLAFDTDGKIDISANFNIKTTPLGTDSSKLAIYSDGKIAVDFTESPVVITSENIFRQAIPLGQHSLNNISIPRSNEFDFFEIGIEGIVNLFTTVKTTHNTVASNIRPNSAGTSTTPPTGINAWIGIFQSLNLTAGTIENVRLCYAPNMGNWQFFNATVGSPLIVYVNGLKAR